MGNMRGAAVAMSLIGGLKNAQNERRNILAKRTEQSQNNEMFKIDKQMATLDLKKRQQQGQLDDIGYKVASERLGTLFKAFDAQSKAEGMMINDAESKNKGQIDMFDASLTKMIESFMPKAGPIDLSKKPQKASVNQELVYEINQIVSTGNGKYRIVDFDEDGEPLVEKAE